MKTGTSLLTFIFALLWASSGFAQNHKGISFQGVIKLPSGEAPTRSGLTVVSRILSPNDCILREEQFVGINISNGYINVPIGTGVTGGYDPGLSLKQVMDNSTTLSSLTCLNVDGSVNGAVTTFNPTVTNGARKFRLSLTIDSVPIVADFNMRAMAYAVNSESLNGKTESSFINTSAAITQSAAESWFASSVMGQLLAGTYNAPTATSALNVSGTVAIANGGTGATTAAGARTALGLSPIATSGSASDLTSGTVPTARLGTGTADATTYLRGDGTWATVTGGVSSVAGKTGAVTLQAADVTDFNTAADARIGAQKAQNNGLASLNASGKVPSTQLALSASDIPSLDAAKITSGTVTQDVNATSVGGITGSFTNLRIYDGASQFLTMTLPTGGTGYSLKWPNAVGGNGQVLQTDASGNLSWVTPSSAGITALTGDVTATGPGSAAATIAAGAVTSGKILDGTIVKGDLNFAGVNSATSGFVVVDSTGKFTDFACATAGHVPTWTVTGWACQAPNVGTVTGVTASAPLASSGGAAPVISISNGSASGQVLRWNGSNWVAAQLSNSDVTGLGSLATKNSVDLSSADATGTLDAARMPGLTGDVTSSAGSTATTLSNTGVAAGTYSKVTVDAKGRVTTAANIGSSDVTTALGFTPLNKAGDVMSGLLGLNGVTADPAGLVAGDKGKVWYRTDTNEIKYWNGSAAVALGASGAGLQSLNGLTSSAQTFAVDSAGTDVAINSATSTHTLSIPSASATNRGVLTSADWTTFNNKLGTATSFSGDVSGNYNSISVDKIKGTGVTITSLTTKNYLKYNGTSWVNAMIDAATDLTGILPVANGGTGANTLASGNLLIGGGTGAVTTLAAGGAGNILYGTGISSWASGSPDAAGLVDISSTQTISGAKGFTNYIQMSAQNEVRFADADSSNYVSIKSPATVAANVTLTLPSTAGSSGQVLTTNGSGVLSWNTPSAATALSTVTAATATNTIDNLNYGQVWNWSTASTQSPLSVSANALTTGSLLSLTTSNASLNSTNGLLYVANTGTSTSGITARIQSNSTAGSGVTLLGSGNLGVGTTSPGSTLTVAGTIESTSGGIKFPDGSVQSTSAVGGTNNSIYSGFPDYVKCTYASNGDYVTLPLFAIYPSISKVEYYNSGYALYLNFDGTYSTSSTGLYNGGTFNCVNKTVTQLYASNQAYNIVKGPAAQWLQSGSNAYYNAGSVGVGTSTPNSSLHVAGSLATATGAQSANYTLGASDNIVLSNASAGTITQTLPSAVGISGRQYTIKKTDSSANAVSIATTSSQTIDGSTTYSLTAQYQYVTVVSDGANWNIIGASASGLGVGQTWTNVTASRALSTVYTNTTGKPIFVFINTGTGSPMNYYINGTQFGYTSIPNGGSFPISFIVPPGGTYQVTGGTLLYWFEYR